MIFAFPFLFLLLITSLYYETEKGDLIRTGYIPNFYPDYRNKFEAELDREILFDRISDGNISKEYDVLTIGDSFSEQGAAGYQNFLVAQNEISLLHVDYIYHTNPIQFLISLKNSNFFKEIKVKNVILQGVERHIVSSSVNLNYDSILDIKSLDSQSKNNFNLQDKKIVSNRIFKFPFSVFMRWVYPEKMISAVYSRKLSDKVFSVKDDKLYFYYLDISKIEVNNSLENVENLNSVLNKLNDDLNEDGVNLIFLPVPDKYNFYRDNLKNPTDFPTPQFFHLISKLNKSYKMVDLMELKRNKKLELLDFYYYDDSHWSPVGSELVARFLNDFVIN